MNKEEELKCAIATLDKCIQEMHSIIDGVARLLETKADEKTSTKGEEISLEAIRGILADKSQKGHTGAIKDILQSYGASKLSELEPSVYTEVIEKVEALGHGN